MWLPSLTFFIIITYFVCLEATPMVPREEAPYTSELIGAPLQMNISSNTSTARLYTPGQKFIEFFFNELSHRDNGEYHQFVNSGMWSALDLCSVKPMSEMIVVRSSEQSTSTRMNQNQPTNQNRPIKEQK